MMATCWECGAETSRPQGASLRSASGATRTFQLCPTCYRDCYLPLTADGESGIEIEDGRRGIPNADWPTTAQMRPSG
jgi:hypothetical protein